MSIPNKKPKLDISLSRGYLENKQEICEAFEGFDVRFKGELVYKSVEQPVMQIIIFIGKTIAGGIIYNLLKRGIKKIFHKFSDAEIIVRDSESIMYYIKQNLNVNVVVVPERRNKFSHIETLKDLVQHLKNKAKKDNKKINNN